MQSNKLFPTGHRGRGGFWLISNRGLGPPAGPARNTWLHWLPGLISGHQVGVSLWADNPMWMNCCHCARGVTSCARLSPFLGAIFLSLHLLVLMSGQPVSPGRQPRGQCPRQSLSAFAFWLWWPCGAIGWHLRAQKGRWHHSGKGRLRLPRWRASPVVYFLHAGISVLVVVVVLTLASWAL